MLSNEIDSFLKNKKNPTSERAYIIQKICDHLFDDKQFKKILGQTKQFTVTELKDIFDQAKSWEKNPSALFWKLVKEKKEKIQEDLKKD